MIYSNISLNGAAEFSLSDLIVPILVKFVEAEYDKVMGP